VCERKSVIVWVCDCVRVCVCVCVVHYILIVGIVFIEWLSNFLRHLPPLVAPIINLINICFYY